MPIQIDPTVLANFQRGQESTPEWAKVLAQLLPVLSPTGPTGAALSMAPGQAQPQSTWGQLALLAPIALGALGAVSGKGKSSLDELQRLFAERGKAYTAQHGAIPEHLPTGKLDQPSFFSFVRSMLPEALMPRFDEHTAAVSRTPAQPALAMQSQRYPATESGLNWLNREQAMTFKSFEDATHAGHVTPVAGAETPAYEITPLGAAHAYIRAFFPQWKGTP